MDCLSQVLHVCICMQFMLLQTTVLTVRSSEFNYLLNATALKSVIKILITQPYVSKCGCKKIAICVLLPWDKSHFTSE